MKETRYIIGENIKRLRKDRGWTAGFVADELQVNQSHISRIERGKSVTVETLDKLAGVFGIQTFELLKPFEVEDMNLREKLEKFSELPQLKQDMVEQMIDAFLKENQA